MSILSKEQVGALRVLYRVPKDSGFPLPDDFARLCDSHEALRAELARLRPVVEAAKACADNAILDQWSNEVMQEAAERLRGAVNALRAAEGGDAHAR